jgi:large subunit ribosomal protein L13
MDELMGKLGGAEVLRKAVSGMLPKNRLRDDRLARLKAFEGDAHPYKGNIVKFNGKTITGAEWPERKPEREEKVQEEVRL